ncbi:MAG: hypothetical protein QOF88_7685 [Mycobacterium sp.]|jgi:hypothetical protein|nr:hypothetical protein [Mycobacterium sp.]
MPYRHRGEQLVVLQCSVPLESAGYRSQWTAISSMSMAISSGSGTSW